MAKSYEASGKTVDEAIDLACMLAGTTIENVEIEILELGGKGLFGLGQKDARVKVTVEEKEQPKVKEPVSTFGKKKQRRESPNKKPQAQTEEIRPIIVVEPGDQCAAYAIARIPHCLSARIGCGPAEESGKICYGGVIAWNPDLFENERSPFLQKRTAFLVVFLLPCLYLYPIL